MAKIKILKSKDYKEDTNASYSLGMISLTTNKMGFLGYKQESIDETDFTSLEKLTEESAKGYSLKSGLIGGVLTGGVGLLAGFMLPKNKDSVLFKAILKNKKEFLGQTDKKTFNKLLLKNDLLG